MKLWILPIAATLCGCGMPDARVATVQTSEELKPAVSQAIAFWQRAGADLDWRFGNCRDDSRDAGSEQRTCVQAYFGPQFPDSFAYCKWGDSTIERNIVVQPGLTGADLQQVVTHEVGHALHLNHAKDGDIDLMRPGEMGAYCVSGPTRRQWEHLYGTSLDTACAREADPIGTDL